MLSCFSISRGHSLRTPDRESVCETLRRRLTPSGRCRPHCSSHTSVTDTAGEVSPGVNTSDLPESGCHGEVSLSANATGTESGKSRGQESARPETPSSSGQVSPELSTENLERQSPGVETEVTATGPQETLRSPVYIHPGLAAAIRNNLTESLAESRPVWFAQTVRPHSFTKPFLPFFLGSQPVYGPFFPGTSTSHTPAQLALSLGRDIVTASFENYSSSEGLCDKDGDVRCLDNIQLFTTDWVEEEGDFYTVSPQLELDEAFKLSGLKNSCSQNELLIYLSPCIPEHPKVPCPEEKKSILHRAASGWRKLLCANGHASQAKCFSRTHCAVCTEHVEGLGHQVYKCTSRKLSVHKCHELVTIECGQHSLPSEPMVPVDPPSVASDPAQTAIPCNLSSHKALGQVDEENEAGNTRENGKASPRLSLQDVDLLHVIGRGSYGKVLQVQLKKSDRTYAIKTVKKELVNTDRIGTEKYVLQQISNHPFLVGIHSYVHTESRLFFVLDYVNGGDLMFHMQKQRILPEEHARFYSAEIGLVFNYLHQKGILYRNLKLDNVLLDSEGYIKLTDYCICKEGLEPGDMTGTFCGTPNYLAPEIIRGKDYGFSVDWWTLGVLMYETMIGESPFHLAESSDNPGQNSNNNLLQVILERKIHIPRYLSIKAASVLKSFLNRDPKERLGCRPQRGLADIQVHPFFQDVDWEMLEQKQVVPPFKPNMSGGFGLDNFDSQFTDGPFWLTPNDNDIVREIEGCEFAGFEYVNCLTMYEEEWV